MVNYIKWVYNVYDSKIVKIQIFFTSNGTFDMKQKSEISKKSIFPW